MHLINTLHFYPVADLVTSNPQFARFLAKKHAFFIKNSRF